MRRGQAVIVLISAVALLIIFGGFAFLYYMMVLSTGLLDAMYFILVCLLFAASLRLRPFLALMVSAFLGVLLLFPLSLFLYISANDGLRFLGFDGPVSMAQSPMFLLWLTGYVLALCVAQLAARKVIERR